MFYTSTGGFIGKTTFMDENINQPQERYTVPAVEQAMRILFQMAEDGSSHMTLTEIYSKASISKSKAFSILQTLKQFGVIQRDVDGKGYSLGPGLIMLSRKVLDNFNAPRLAEPILKNLAKAAGGTATFGLIADDKVFVAAKYEEGTDIGITIRVGQRFPLTYGSHGKAIVPFLPSKEQKSILDGKKLYFHGTPEKLDRNRLDKELAACRRDGYAVDLGEIKPGLNTVASPVLGIDGFPIGYIAVIGLFSAGTVRSLGPSVSEAGIKLSRQLGAVID
jgi:DNA-binding IclR family transcriptional regulator